MGSTKERNRHKQSKQLNASMVGDQLETTNKALVSSGVIGFQALEIQLGNKCGYSWIKISGVTKQANPTNSLYLQSFSFSFIVWKIIGTSQQNPNQEFSWIMEKCLRTEATFSSKYNHSLSDCLEEILLYVLQFYICDRQKNPNLDNSCSD